MIKRKINPDYLRQITSSEIRDEMIDSLAFARSLKSFIDEYLCGIASARIEGESIGMLSLKLPVVSYLVRLLSEVTDDTVEITITLSSPFKLSAGFKSLCDVEKVAHIVSVARLCGFDVEREENTLVFSAKLRTTATMKIYATSSDEFRDMLVTTYKM